VCTGRPEAGAYGVGASDEKRHALGADADLGSGCTRVIAGSAFEIEPDGNQILRHQLAHSPRDSASDWRPVDTAILCALHAHSALNTEAARLKIEQRLLLVEPHQQLRPGARGAAHLDTARGIGRREE